MSRRLLLLWALLLGVVMAEDFVYQITPSKTDPYCKEPILLRIDLNQTNPAVVLLFHFKVNESADYRVRPLSAQHNDTLHHTQLSNLYELYPLKTGEINVTFTLVKRVTNDAKVRYFSSGDRDDFKKLETEDTPIDLPPLKLQVRPLPPGTQLVGDYTLSYSLKTQSAEAFAPIPLEITLKGRGYPPEITQLFPKSDRYRLFAQKPQITHYSTPNGTQIKAVYLYAVSAKEDFDLPEVRIGAFDPFRQRTYTLTLPSHHFTIQSVDREQLVDTHDTPPPLQWDLSWVWHLLGYLSAFVAGGMSALLWQRRRATVPSSEPTSDPLQQKIQACEDPRALLQLLLANPTPAYRDAIGALEAHLYRGRSLNLKRLKASLTKPSQGAH